MTEEAFAKVLRAHGARVFIVGGWVRDALRHVRPHDKDYMVSGIAEADFQQLFPDAQKVGHGFPVYLVSIDGCLSEVAFARKERKEGQGYRGFRVSYDPSVTVEEDLYRRDTTMNSMALELPAKTLIDPYHGARDVEKGIIRAVSPHFMEDPVRALRAARQAAEFGFSIAEQTSRYMHACREELQGEPQERIVAELRRALQAERPSVFFRALERAGILSVTFPELSLLIGKTQPPEYHPEGDAWQHTLLVVDRAASKTANVAARFAALVHDLGKGTTPKAMEPHHYGHEQRGLAQLAAWDRRVTLPKDWLRAGRFLIEQHMRAPLLERPGKIAALLLAIDKQCSVLTLADFNAVIEADHHSLPDYLRHGERLLAAMHGISGKDAPKELRGRAIGQWLAGRQTARLVRELTALRATSRLGDAGTI